MVTKKKHLDISASLNVFNIAFLTRFKAMKFIRPSVILAKIVRNT
jgi:hypothetical protein